MDPGLNWSILPNHFFQFPCLIWPECLQVCRTLSMECPAREHQGDRLHRHVPCKPENALFSLWKLSLHDWMFNLNCVCVCSLFLFYFLKYKKIALHTCNFAWKILMGISFIHSFIKIGLKRTLMPVDSCREAHVLCEVNGYECDIYASPQNNTSHWLK